MGVNDKDRSETLYVRIPRQHKEDLQRVADSLGLKVSHITRYAIQHYLYGTTVPGAAPSDGDGQEVHGD
jgi:hypothetical protein